MQIGNRFRFYPASEQAQTLLRWIGCQRFIYNAKVGEDRYFQSFARKSVALAGQHAPVDQKYAQFIGDETTWLKEVPSVLLRNGAVLWMQAYSRFFCGLGGRPSIQKKYGRQSVWLTNELFEFIPVATENGEIVSHRLMVGTKKFPIGEIKFKAHKAFQVPASIHLSVHASQWYVSFNYDDGVPEPKDEETAAWLQSFERNELSGKTLGLDRGVAIPLAGSDGCDFDFTPAHQKRLAQCNRHAKRWQRIAARRKKGGSNRRQANARVARYQQAQANIRREFAHQTSHVLAGDDRHSLYVFEALKVKNMTRNAKGTLEDPGQNVRQKAGLNRSILSSAWGQTKRYLQYKARRAGKLVVEVPAAYSSQTCSACGHVHQDNRLNQSRFVCQACGHSENADTNAAKVIRNRGVELVLSGHWKVKAKKRCAITRNKVGQDLSEPTLETVRTLTESSVSRMAGFARCTQGTMKWEAPVTTPSRGLAGGVVTKASITQTKNQLSALLDRVRHGETVLIMDRGRPVARLEPVTGESNAETAAIINELERTGVVRPPRRHVDTDLLLQDPLPAPRGASALQALLEERREAR